MFEMMVEDAIRANDIISSFGGRCNDCAKFKSPLFDDAGNRYDVYMPLTVEPLFNSTQITLAIKNFPNINTLKGKRLHS
jgi:hypothetical protein